MSSSPFLRHIERCHNVTLPSLFSQQPAATQPHMEQFLPLFYGQRSPENLIGWVSSSLLPLLQTADFQDLLRIIDHSDEQPSGIKASLLVYPEKTSVEQLSGRLIKTGLFKPFNELFDVRLADRSVIGQVDRGLIPLLGIRAEGVHLNALVQKKEGLFLWVAQRSSTKRLEPNKLDNLAAGGISAGFTPEQTLLKEAEEEANLPSSYLKTAQKTACLSYITKRGEGLHHDTLHCFDVILPNDFVPQATDGEVENFHLMPLQAVFERVRETDDFKFNVNLVLIDLLIRYHFFEKIEEKQLREALHAMS